MLIWFVNFVNFCNGQNLGCLKFFVKMHKLFLWLFMGLGHEENLRVLVNKWLPVFFTMGFNDG